VVYFTMAYVNVKKPEWLGKTVTTNPPACIPHQEFSWRCELVSDENFYAVLLFCYDNIIEFQKLYAADASNNVIIELSFYPHNWNNSDLVQINLSQHANNTGGNRCRNVENGNLKNDPRKLVDVHVDNASLLPMGKLIDLAIVNHCFKLFMKVFLISQSDTEVVHGRWRLKKDILASSGYDYVFLSTGKIVGQINTEQLRP